MADEKKDEKKEMKPWEDPIFRKSIKSAAPPPPKPAPKPAPKKEKKRPSDTTDEAEETLRKIRKRNDELVKRYGEKGSSAARQPAKKKDSSRSDSHRR